MELSATLARTLDFPLSRCTVIFVNFHIWNFPKNDRTTTSGLLGAGGAGLMELSEIVNGQSSG